MSPHAVLNDGNAVIVPDEQQTKTIDKSHVLHRSLHNKPHTVVAAQGLYLTLSNGQKILDATGGAAVSCLGHNHPRVKAAIAKQQDTVSYCHSLFFGTQAGEELADELVRGTNGKMARCFIVSSGKFPAFRAMVLAEKRRIRSDGGEHQAVPAIFLGASNSPATKDEIHRSQRKLSRYNDGRVSYGRTCCKASSLRTHAHEQHIQSIILPSISQQSRWRKRCRLCRQTCTRAR